MSRLIDRICERAPALAALLLGAPTGGDAPPPEPVVIVADGVLPRGPSSPLADLGPFPPGCLPPWPSTFLEISMPTGVPAGAGEVPVVTTIGWLFTRPVGGGPEAGRIHALLVAEAGARISGPLAVLELVQDAEGQLARRPEFVSLARASGGEAGRRRLEARFLEHLDLALLAVSRMRTDDAVELDVYVSTPEEDEERMARGLFPLFPHFVLVDVNA